MNKKELRELSKNQLIEIILRQEERLAEIERLLRSFDNPHTPSSKERNKQNTVQDETKPRFPGKPEGGNGAGIEMPKPDKKEIVKKDNCPECGGELGKCKETYTFRQMDIPNPKFITTKYVVECYTCNQCGIDIDAGKDLPKGFYGPNTTAFLGCLRDEGLSNEAISRFMQTTYMLPISHVAVFNKLVQLASLMQPEREEIKEIINKTNHVNMDETGLRRDGQNGYVWNVCTENYCLFEYDQSRSADVAKRMLSNFKGVITTDDYRGYWWHALHQLCWSHLLREAKEIAEKYEESETQYTRLKNLYRRAKEAQENNAIMSYDSLVWELKDIANCYLPLDGCKNMYSKIHNRTNLWLLGVKLPYVSLTNNRAERSLRKIVLHRNRIGCIRNNKGKEFINTFLTCTSTWRLQGQNVYQNLLAYSS